MRVISWIRLYTFVYPFKFQIDDRSPTQGTALPTDPEKLHCRGRPRNTNRAALHHLAYSLVFGRSTHNLHMHLPIPDFSSDSLLVFVTT
jgi:hypothetical protein